MKNAPLLIKRGFPVDAGRSYKLHKMALRKIRKHIRSLKSSKTEKAALGSISEGGRLFVITYYISLSATHGHFISRQNFIPLFREYRHPKSALNGSVISSL